MTIHKNNPELITNPCDRVPPPHHMVWCTLDERQATTGTYKVSLVILFCGQVERSQLQSTPLSPRPKKAYPMSHGLQGQDKNKNADHFASKISALFLQMKWVGKAKVSWRRGPLSFREQRPHFLRVDRERRGWKCGAMGYKVKKKNKTKTKTKHQTWSEARGLEVQ